MGLISRKENRVRQRREAAQHTAPMQGLPTEKRALSRRAKAQMYGKDRQRRGRDVSRAGTGKGMLAEKASGGPGERKGWQGLSKNRDYHAHTEAAEPAVPIF